MNTRKLIFVINHMDWFWSHRLPLAEGAKQAGWDVHVCAAGAQDDQRLQENNFQGLALSSCPHKILIDLWRVMAQEKPDLIHVITLKYAFFCGLVSRFHPNIKIIHTIAGLGYLFSGEGFKPKILRALIGPLLKFALKHENAKIIFQNPDDMALMIKRGFVHERQCHLIKGSGVDLTQYKAKAEPKEKEPLIVMTTRLVHDKGVAVFIEAAKILQERGVKARYQIAGGAVSNNPLGISECEMNEMIDGSPVEWLGRISDMPKLYAEANMIVYPSYYGEGVPKVLLEAAATGRAIITTDHAGCREAVEDGKTGFLVPIKDPKATADAMETLIKDTKLRAAMGKAARSFAQENFDVKSVVARTIALYD